MKRVAALLLSGCIATLAAAGEPVGAPELTAARIVEKNIAARGGLGAWRKIQTMAWRGHIESANVPAPSLPFVLELKRPNKTRFEIEAQNQLTARVYDGIHGWKVRPGRSGMPEVQPYTAEELRFAQDGQGIDGPLMDYQAKGIAVALDGVEDVEGKKAYRLKVTLPSGASHHVWIDAHSYLDIKYDRESRNAVGMSGTVAVYNRDFRKVEGVQIPFVIESGADSGKPVDKMVIDKILLNPPLEDRLFARPVVPGQRHRVSVNATRPRAVRHAPWPASAMSPGFANAIPSGSGVGR